MTEDKWQKLEKLYDLTAKSAGSPGPKRALFGWKCPKCGVKLSKKSVKEIVFLGDSGELEGSQLVKRILADTKLEPAVYTMSISRFNCTCGYEFAKVDFDPMTE